MEAMTTEQIDLQKRVKEIRERAEKATPGEWKLVQAAPPLRVSAGNRILFHRERYDAQDVDNFELAARARQDIPWLLDQLALEQKRVKELEEQNQTLEGELAITEGAAHEFKAELEPLRERVKELEWAQSTEKLNAALALDSDSTVASCNCLTKTPDIQFHKIGCKYRLISERDQLRAERDELRRDKERLDWLDARKASVSWCGYGHCYIVQKAGQVLGNIGKGLNPREAIDQAKAALTESQKESDATPGSPAL